MTQTEKTITALEGRLLAHRRVLSELLNGLPQPARESIADWLAERVLPQDGQEDPGAVPSEGLGLELSMADEYRELTKLVRNVGEASD